MNFSKGRKHYDALTIPKAKKEIDDEISIFEHVVSYILEDFTADSSPKSLNADLVIDILRGYGEGSLEDNQNLVQEMVKYATTNMSCFPWEIKMLNVHAFIDAQTTDVARKYDPGRNNGIWPTYRTFEITVNIPIWSGIKPSGLGRRRDE